MTPGRGHFARGHFWAWLAPARSCSIRLAPARCGSLIPAQARSGLLGLGRARSGGRSKCPLGK
eukprot:12583794-Alexandrium_andersonii.AAC.1